MNNTEISLRREVYKKIANEISLLNNNQLSELLESSAPIGTSIGGSSSLLKISDTNVFIKKIRLTDIERLPENEMSTVNLFHLPLYYQYGVGSTGFGAWRELAAHILSTNWVLTSECPNFPILYHWRVLRSSSQEPDEAQLVKLDKDVKYWNNSPAIHDRLEANLYASANIVLFLEYFPQNLYQWFGNQIAHGESVIETACEMIEKHLNQTISFMKSQNFIHFDAHFHNILTDGNHLYFSDFGLAISANFELSKEERSFFNYHLDYDGYSAATNFLHCFVTHYVGKDKWIESLHELMNEKLQKLPPYFSAIIKRYAPTALLMDKFFRDLQKDKTTTYPAKELELAWDAVEKIVTYQIKTKRIGIRLLEKEDVNYLFGLESDPEVQRFSPSGAKTYKQTEAVINEFISDYKEKGLPCFILFDLVSGEFIGRAAFIQWEAGDIEVGYSLHKKFWGKGYATEVLTLLLAWARKNIVTDYISACSELDNLASLRVLEKCGMKYYKSSIEHGVECRLYRIKNR